MGSKEPAGLPLAELWLPRGNCLSHKGTLSLVGAPLPCGLCSSQKLSLWPLLINPQLPSHVQHGICSCERHSNLSHGASGIRSCSCF